MLGLLGYMGDDTEDVSPEFLEEEPPELSKLPFSCKVCGFGTALLCQESEQEAIKAIAESMHEHEFPNCEGELRF
ncbi:hypothetical protein KKH23_01230 [Patescibacteria group bacterium]|nr:hypothetical protein [Patescibacteria group bacterium]MBU0845808.1 hypothetical protein [Patescibacteria group bacterium]MBU0922835.1 hypothetical protein [Patescibacteria group bacterium]MBU1066432.1 hypothetical protein [Patescibacteria group bacterium]